MNRANFVNIEPPPVLVTVNVALTFEVSQNEKHKAISLLFAEVNRMLQLYHESGNLVYRPIPTTLSGFAVAMKDGDL